MSTVKHQPATPLPFSTKDDDIIYGADGSDAGAPEVSDQNLAYVIHAANAYPKLVEALRKLVRQAMPDPDKATGAHIAAASLLGDLGEEQ